MQRFETLLALHAHEQQNLNFRIFLISLIVYVCYTDCTVGFLSCVGNICEGGRDTLLLSYKTHPSILNTCDS